MTTEWFKNFIDTLGKLLDKPPYLFLVFIGAVFTVISLISGNHFEQIWLFFLFSVAGTIWRYIERDFLRPSENHPKIKLSIQIVYHIGNIGLFASLLYYLGLIRI